VKITKRQLRRIIKEEKAKILKESISDMSPVANDVGLAASQIADVFADQMSFLYEEEPDAFARPDPNGSGMIRTPKEEWMQQVFAAAEELEEALESAINKSIERIEMQLHDGQYHRGF
jgi:hypothetical protein